MTSTIIIDDDCCSLLQVREAPSADSAELEALLEQPLQPHPELRVGQLANGLRYVILPNKVPPQRFEAHLEIHAGKSCIFGVYDIGELLKSEIAYILGNSHLENRTMGRSNLGVQKS